MPPSPRIRFDARSTSFHDVLRGRVDAYFTDRNLSRHADSRVVLKMVFWLIAFAALYAGILSGVVPGIAVVLLGFIAAQIGFNVGHDALHRATSGKKWVNTFLGWSFDLLGGSSFAWKRAHNVVHHSYTNVAGVDRDIDAGPWMRFHPHERAKWVHRWQHWFAFGFYTLTMLAWIFAKDFVDLATKRESARTWAGVLTGKVIHFAVFIAIPMAVMPLAWWQIAIGYVAMQMAVGLTLAVVFQLAHVVEETSFPLAGKGGVLGTSWAEHQLHTTANFCAGGRVATFLTGGLNHQIEHHLFPTVSHAHYGALSSIVRATAAEHGLPYHESLTFMGAVRSHLRALRALGAPQVA